MVSNFKNQCGHDDQILYHHGHDPGRDDLLPRFGTPQNKPVYQFGVDMKCYNWSQML